MLKAQVLSEKFDRSLPRVSRRRAARLEQIKLVSGVRVRYRLPWSPVADGKFLHSLRVRYKVGIVVLPLHEQKRRVESHQVTPRERVHPVVYRHGFRGEFFDLSREMDGKIPA